MDRVLALAGEGSPADQRRSLAAFVVDRTGSEQEREGAAALLTAYVTGSRMRVVEAAHTAAAVGRAA